MKNALILYLLFVSFTLFSCSSSRDKMSEKITKMESELKTITKVDSNSVSTLISAYQNFAVKYPADSLSPEYLYRAAGLANGFNRGTQAIDLYETIIHTYPAYKRIPECYFMEAFAWENVQGNIAKASEYYNKFLDKYPDHQLADDARAALKLLGKTPDEIVGELEKMNADTVITKY
jgi:outer membrane protein assembly factor BamD (BamD/ComL family)